MLSSSLFFSFVCFSLRSSSLFFRPPYHSLAFYRDMSWAIYLNVYWICIVYKQIHFRSYVQNATRFYSDFKPIYNVDCEQTRRQIIPSFPFVKVNIKWIKCDWLSSLSYNNNNSTINATAREKKKWQNTRYYDPITLYCWIIRIGGHLFFTHALLAERIDNQFGWVRPHARARHRRQYINSWCDCWSRIRSVQCVQ